MNHDEPKRIMRKGTIADLPKFCMATELLKAARYAKFGKSENYSDNNFYQATQNHKLDHVLKHLNGEMSSAQVADAVGCSTSAAYKWLTKLGEIGAVDSRAAKINDRRTILFWRTNT